MISPFTLSVNCFCSLPILWHDHKSVVYEMLWSLCLVDRRDGNTCSNKSQIDYSLGTDHSDSAMENSEINYSMTLRCHFIVHEVHLIVSFHLPKNPRQSLLLD